MEHPFHLVFRRQVSKDSKKRHPSCLQNLSRYFTEYSENTTIHGVKFLGEKQRSKLEKLWWLIFLTISLYICLLLIVKTYRKWENSPVIVTFATSETPIWKIPFPAVTICPQVKKTSGNSYADLKMPGKNFTSKQKFEYLDLICPKSGWAYESTKATTDNEMLNFLMRVQPDFDTLVHYCFWAEDYCHVPLSETFKPIITSEGVCYSFNILDRNEIFSNEVDMSYYEEFSIPHQPQSQWNLEKGYTNVSVLKTFPLRTMVSGIPGGLELVFRTEFSQDDYICEDFSQGYKIVLHHPAEIPNTKQRYMRVGFTHDVSAAVKINMMTTSEALRDYHPKERKCYFAKERQLRFFRLYSQQNCLFECLSNFTYKRCGCVNFYMPRDSFTPICGLGKIWCLTRANNEFLENEVQLEINSQSNLETGHRRSDYPEGCNCLPSCYSLDFDAEISQTDWIWYGSGDSKYGFLGNESSSYSRVQIYFKDMQFITLERNELYGQTDFLASCGGLLGLFTGFSFISLVEILYFVSLRFVCNFRRYGRHYWSGADDLLAQKGNRYQLEQMEMRANSSATFKTNHQEQHPSCLENLDHYFTEYAENTSIHGLRYLVKKGRNVAEKLWWFIFVLVSLYCCVVLIVKTYRKWERSPVIVTFATSQTPVYTIPFSAVTVCSQTKHIVTEFGPERWEYLDLICPKFNHSYATSPSVYDDDIISYFMEAQPDFDLATRECSWIGKDCGFPLTDLFNAVVTSEGVCYTFNILDRDEIFAEDVDLEYYENFSVPHQPPSKWSPEKGYVNESDFKTFPFRTLMSGVQGGLEIIFRMEILDDSFICESTPGYKVVLHNPAEIPNLNQRHIRVGLDQDISAVVRPDIMTTSEGLRDYSPKDRKCYFSSEKRLRFFKIYNQGNCFLECLANFTLTRCGCVNFHMPRVNSTSICGLQKLSCMKRASKILLQREVNYQEFGRRADYDLPRTSDSCNCLPSCHSLKFEAEISHAQFGLQIGGIRNEYFEDTSARYSRLQIFFKDMQFITSEKRELYGPTDFVANCGGLVGLFIGFSLISAIEFLYFATLRLICNFRIHRRHYWSGLELV